MTLFFSYQAKNVLITLLTLPLIVSTAYGQKTTNGHFDKYKARHLELTPVVAIADIYYGCSVNKLKIKPNHSLYHMVTMLDRNMLADQLTSCLGEQTIKSEDAINYGLHGCFYSQMNHLTEKEITANMAKVTDLLATLSKEEKQKSFTQCVNDQTVGYVEFKK